LHAVADLEFARALHDGIQEAVVNGIFHDDAAGGGAFLAGGEERGVHGVLDGGVEVGIGQHDGGILAAHFQLNAQAAFGGFGMQPVADLAGAREGDSLERRGFHQRPAELAAGSGHEIDHALRQAGFLQGLHQPPGAERRGAGGLQHHGVAADQRGRQFPRRDGAGKIPRRDQAHHADRLANGEHVYAIALGRHQQPSSRDPSPPK
jgi:hypothetical protein